MLLVDGEVGRQPERAPAGDDRDLVDRVGFGDHPGDEHVAYLVVGSDLLLLLRDDQALPLHPHHHFVFRLFEVAHGDGLVVLPCGEKRCLVHQVRELRAGETRRPLGERLENHVVRERDVLRMDPQYPLASLHVRPVDDHLSVESSGPHECGVEDVRPVGGRDDDYAAVLLEAVHLDKELVQGLLPLVVTAAEARAAMAAHRVDLVDEDDAGSALLPLLEKVPHAARADADKHLDEVSAGDREEGDSRLAGHRTRKERLPRSGGSEQQHAARYLPAEFLKLCRLLQEFDDLAELLLGLVGAGDIEECNL